MKYREISQRPFRPGQILNPYPHPLQGGIRFLSRSSTLCAISSPYGVDTSCEERIGLTTFRVVNNVDVLGAIIEPGGIVSVCLGVLKGPLAASAPFGVSVTALFRLFPITILTMIHFTFSMTSLS
jgi:hypothetical protein